MHFILGILIFAFGVIIGSFLNVVSLRYNTGRGLGGRSFCFSCGTSLKFLELVPILSFIFQKGRCKHCMSRISIQYPMVEAITGAVFLLVFLKLYPDLGNLTPLILPYYWLIFSILIVISAYDMKHKIIPDGLAFAFSALALLGFVGSSGFSDIFSPPLIFDLLAGPAFFSVFFLLWALSRGRWIGFGDAKLVLGIGLFLGLSKGISAIIFGFWFGAFWSLCLIFYQKFLRKKSASDKKTLNLTSEIPFAPFLIAGILSAFLFDSDILKLNDLLFSGFL